MRLRQDYLSSLLHNSIFLQSPSWTFSPPFSMITFVSPLIPFFSFFRSMVQITFYIVNEGFLSLLPYFFQAESVSVVSDTYPLFPGSCTSPHLAPPCFGNRTFLGSFPPPFFPAILCPPKRVKNRIPQPAPCLKFWRRPPPIPLSGPTPSTVLCGR